MLAAEVLGLLGWVQLQGFRVGAMDALELGATRRSAT